MGLFLSPVFNEFYVFSFAGVPPLALFFGKVTVLNSVGVHTLVFLTVLACASLIYYSRWLSRVSSRPEIEISQRLRQWSSELLGMQSYCVKAYAEALEVVPYTLAENAGLHPIQIVTELRAMHAKGMKTAGINVRKGTITDILEEKVLQPLLVTSSAIGLASETVRMVLKIDDRIMVA